MKILGNRVEPGEIEANLAEICGSDSVAAVAWPVDHGSARGVVTFHCVEGLAAEKIRDALRQRVPRYAVPQQVVRLAGLPLTANGRVNRNLLVEMLERKAPVR